MSPARTRFIPSNEHGDRQVGHSDLKSRALAKHSLQNECPQAVETGLQWIKAVYSTSILK